MYSMYMLAYCSLNKVVHAGAKVSMHTCITGSTSDQESAQQYYSGYTVLLRVRFSISYSYKWIKAVCRLSSLMEVSDNPLSNP